MPVDRAYQLARAFGFYFELINLAETNHRKRRRLAGSLRRNADPQRGSLQGTLRRMRKAGYTADEAVALLHRICITPVFTAHPTEVARRSVISKRHRIALLLEQLDQIPSSDDEIDRLESSLLTEITGLWQTDDVRLQRPAVTDEVRMGLDYFNDSIFDTLPALYAEVANALHKEYGPAACTARSADAGELWLVDRRRSRWQSVCHAAGHARGVADVARGALRALSHAAEQCGAADFRLRHNR